MKVHAREADRKNYSIDEWYRCARKVKRTKGNATKMAARLNQEKKDARFYFVAYECPYCHGFHVGRQMKKKHSRAARTEQSPNGAQDK